MIGYLKNRPIRQRFKRFQLSGQDETTRLSLLRRAPNKIGAFLNYRYCAKGDVTLTVDYVFLLDPWWNPAVEAQAIDRAHRIGQVRHVFAYRLIARDTVEEKVLQLQQTKRDLADAIISEDNAVLTSLTADDLQILLS